jgi:hypothetical protein
MAAQLMPLENDNYDAQINLTIIVEGFQYVAVSATKVQAAEATPYYEGYVDGVTAQFGYLGHFIRLFCKSLNLDPAACNPVINP